MRDSLPKGFVDFVVSRGPALHRTAVLLTRQEQAAHDLVQIALAKAWPDWTQIDDNPEAYVRRIMINEFAPGRPRRQRGEVSTAELPEPSLPDDDRDLDLDLDDDLSMRQVLMAELATLPPRQRAVVVLRFFHNYAEAATAEAMGTRVRTVKTQTVNALAALHISEELSGDAAPDLTAPAHASDAPSKRTTDDLRDALNDEADAATYPDVDALVAGARRRAASTRRRRLSALGATTVAVLLVGGLIAATSSARQPMPVPVLPEPVAALGPFTVNAGGAGFPEYSQGMKRVTVLDSPMLERAKGSIIIPTTAGRSLAVRMTCTPTGNVENMMEWDARMLARFTIPDGTRQAACGGADGHMWSIGTAVAAKTTVLANVFVSHEPSPSLPSLFKNAKIHVAIYESVKWEDYHFPARPADQESSPEYDWWSGPGEVQTLGPTTVLEANTPLTFVQPFDPKLALNLQYRGPGRIRVLINGKDISGQIDGTPTQDRFVNIWNYHHSGFDFSLDPAVWFDPTGTAGLTTPLDSLVTVTIEPQDFQGPDWRITVVQSQNPTNLG
jgi:RNA polymerase sigma factor (sigma-70 family)